jgi:hypothetical protein
MKMELPRHRLSGKLAISMQNQLVIAGGGQFTSNQPN